MNTIIYTYTHTHTHTHTQIMQALKNDKTWDFPGGAVVMNPPANAGDSGSSPGPGRSHAAEQLSPCATTTAPAL